MKTREITLKFDRALFGKVVRVRREEFGVTQAEVASQIGMSEGFVSGVERGCDGYLTITTMLLLINELEIPIWRYNLWVAD